MIRTNKLEIKFNEENIKRDFKIYKVKLLDPKSKKENTKYINSNFLDFIAKDVKICSTVFDGYGNAYVLLDNKNSIIEKFKSYGEDYADIMEMIDIQVFQAGNPEVPLYLIAQLFFNYITNPKFEKFKLNNVSGKLFYDVANAVASAKNKGTFYLLELRVDKDCNLCANVRTFGAISKFKPLPDYVVEYHKYRKYVFDKNTGKLRKLLREDNCSDDKIYIQRSPFKNTKNIVPFINFNSYNTIKKSKVGAYHLFFQDVQCLLKNYLTINTKYFKNYEEFDTKKQNIELQIYKTILENHSIKIEDTINTPDSKSLITELKKEIKNFCNNYNIDYKILESSKNSPFIFKIIHHKKYYESHKDEQDPYQEKNNENIVQHITLEDFSPEKAAVENIVQELLIKNDLKNKKISLANWPYNYQLTFAVHHYIKDNKEKKHGDNYNVYQMIIEKNGEFSFKKFHSKDSNLTPEQQKLIEIFGNNPKKVINDIEGLVYSTPKNINIIKKTNTCTLPETQFVNLLKEVSVNEKIKIAPILEGINKLKEKKDFTTEEVINLELFLKDQTTDVVSRKDLKPLFNIAAKPFILLNQYLSENFGIIYHPKLRTNSNKDKYFFSLLDIKYFTEHDKLYYFIGAKSDNLKNKLPNGDPVREVSSTKDDIFFHELMPTLAVNFVRNGQYTVVPFPFKYIREYIIQDK